MQLKWTGRRQKEFIIHLQFERTSTNTVQACSGPWAVDRFCRRTGIEVLGVCLQDLEACIKSQLDAGRATGVARMISSWKAFTST